MYDTSIARITVCVSSLRKQVGDSPWNYSVAYHGQQGDVSQSVREKYKILFFGGQNLTVLEGNVSVYQVYSVSRITGEDRAEFFRAWGPGFEHEGAGGGEGL